MNKGDKVRFIQTFNLQVADNYYVPILNGTHGVIEDMEHIFNFGTYYTVELQNGTVIKLFNVLPKNNKKVFILRK
jgi:hypothetical protein